LSGSEIKNIWPVKLAPFGAKFKHRAEIGLNSLEKFFAMLCHNRVTSGIKPVKLAPFGAKFEHWAKTLSKKSMQC